MKRTIPQLRNTLILLCFLTAIPFSAAAKKTFTLEQCLEMAQSRNPAVLASMEKKTQAEWIKKSTFDNMLPKLNMTYGYTYLDNTLSLNNTLSGGEELDISVHNNFALGLTIDQPLFTGFRLTESYHLADLGLKTAIAEEELAKLEITYQTVAAYYNLLMSVKFQEVIEATVKQLSSHYQDSYHFYKNDVIPLNDLLESDVYLANAKQDSRLAATRTRTAKMTLATLIKEPLSEDIRIIDSPNLAPFSMEQTTLLQKAFTDRPELKRANYSVEASHKQITLAKSDYFPMVSMRAAHNRYGGDFMVDGDDLGAFQQPEESTIGVYANWQLFAWGQTGHNVNQASAANRAAQQFLVKVMDEIQLEVDTNYSSVQVSYENIKTAKKAVQQAEENLRMNTVRYKNQIASSTDVLDAQALLTNTQTKYYQAIYTYNIWLASLARSVGVESLEQLTDDRTTTQ